MRAREGQPCPKPQKRNGRRHNSTVAGSRRLRLRGGFALLVLSAFFYWSQYKWVWIKTTEQSLSTINVVATDARWWFGLLGIFLLAAIFSPFIEQHRRPFFDWFQTPPSREQQVADEIAKATAPQNAQIAILKQQLRDAQQTRQAPAGPPQQTIPQAPPTKLRLGRCRDKNKHMGQRD